MLTFVRVWIRNGLFYNLTHNYYATHTCNVYENTCVHVYVPRYPSLNIGIWVVEVYSGHHDEHETKDSYSCMHDPGNNWHTKQLGLQLKNKYNVSS